MNDFRRTMIWVVLFAAAFLLFNRWNEYQAAKNPVLTPAPSLTPLENQPSTIPSEPSNNSPSSSAADVSSPSQTAGKQQLEKLTTDVLALEFAVNKANIVRSELLNYQDRDDETRHVVLFNNREGKVYYEESGLAGADYTQLNSSFQLVTPISELDTNQDQLQVVFRSAVVNNIQLERTFTIPRAGYVIQVSNKVTNLADKAVQPQLFYQIVRDGGVQKESKLYFTFTGFATYSEESKFQKISFDNIADNSAKLPGQSKNGFIALLQHYFTSAWILPDGAERSYSAKKYGADLYGVFMLEKLPEIAANADYTAQATLYVGPQIEHQLKALAPGFDAVKDYGIFTFISRPTYWVIVKLHSFINNWGWSIVAFVLLLKILFYFLNAKAYTSMAKMKAIQPRITKLKESYKDNPQKMQQEMMRIYREEKVNPLGGCLPILLQMPFFIALYWVLLSSVEFRGAPWMLWVQDLSKPDPFFILPILMAATTLLQTWLNPTPADPIQAKIMWVMPIAFSVMFAFFPSGLVLYWFVNNILAIVQQWIINKRLKVS